jgi:hypothetical protein
MKTLVAVVLILGLMAIAVWIAIGIIEQVIEEDFDHR